MNWNTHYALRDKHAFLGASKHSWLNWDDEKLRESYLGEQAKRRGTRLHDLASRLIKENVRLPDNHQTLSLFVNDAIGFRMQSEQILYYSDNCFGTADAIAFKERDSKLRIHDLKTGITPASMDQLYVYTSLFCLEYAMDPHQLDIELRIYQFDDFTSDTPAVTDILQIMRWIRHADEVLNELKEAEGALWG